MKPYGFSRWADGFRALAFTILALATSAHAQIVNDGATTTLSNVTNTITGDVTVGTNGSFTLLVLSDNALLTNSANSVIGRNVTARSNEVHLISPSARWLMGGTLSVGSNGPFSTLVVDNGAFVRANAGIIGRLATSGSNVVLVTGAGSMWSNVAGGLTVGSLGSGNQLIVSNGGWVVNALGSGSIGSNGSNNVARVTGPGSVWSNRFGLNINPIGAGNANNGLVIEDGGQVFDDDGLINGLSGSSNNFAFISGSGAVWNNSRDLYLGSSVRALLTVSNGGTVLSANSYVGSGGSQMLVTGGGSRWSHQNDLALLGRNNTLVVTNGGWVVNSNGYVGGLTGGDVSASNNIVVLTGVGSTWSNWADLFVGFAGRDNRLVVSNGATVTASNLFVGFQSSSLDNRVTVDGGTLRANTGIGPTLELRRGTNEFNAGLIDVGNLRMTNSAGKFEFNGGRLITRGAFINNGSPFVVGASGTNPAIWEVRSGATNHFLGNHLIVGDASSFHQLLVTGGGLLTNTGNGIFGFNFGANSNSALVSGAGSQWRAGDLFIGNAGTSSRLVVSNGGFVAGSSSYLGNGSSSSNNQAVVTGSGSVWSNRLQLSVGFSGDGNQVVVSNGGALFSAAGVIGEIAGAQSNAAIVIGPGSSWSSGPLTIGQSAGTNRLVVSNGGSVFSSASVVGLNANSTGNVALVTGAGSVWNNAGLAVGAAGPQNRLEVRDGGTVLTTGSGIIGASFDNFSNSVMVTDAGSQWLISSNLIVGTTNDFRNQLVISNGAMVANHEGAIGKGFNSGESTVTVRGSGSVWDNRAGLTLGDRSSRNQLLISEGGRVVSRDARIGLGEFESTSPSGNLVTVAGAGSSWSNSFNIVVGFYGNFNGLVVTNGGLVTAGGVNLGFDDADNDNFVTVTGPDSELRLTGGIDFSGGHSLRLLVTGGGRVVSAGGTIGRQRNSNTATVGGPGSTWTNTGGLTVGDNEAQNTLLAVTNGGSVFATALTIGFAGGGTPDGSRVVVDGGTLRVANAAGTGTLDVRVGSNVLTAGLVDVDRLQLTLPGPGSGFFFNGGTLITRGGLIDNGMPFVVGTNTGTPRIWQVNAGPGDLVVRGGVIVGASFFSSNNLVQLNGGTLRLSNATSTSVFDLRRGINQLNAGVMEMDQLLVTNSRAVFQHNGGSLQPRSTIFSNGSVFTVGNGTSAATLRLLGGTHTFANNLVIAANATLAGNGAIIGNVTNVGIIGAGASAGSLRINGNLRLQNSSVLAFELGGLTPTNRHDQITVTNFAELAGTLSLSLINDFYPAPTNTITLMKFASFSGQFANVPLAGARVNTADNLASFFVSYTPSSVVIGEAQYVDSDGDGMSDMQEMLAGTNPNDPHSVLRITSITKDVLERYVLQFQSVNGKSYHVEYSSDLVTWQSVAGATFTSAGLDPHGHELTQWIDDGSLTGGHALTKRAYRIALQ